MFICDHSPSRQFFRRAVFAAIVVLGTGVAAAAEAGRYPARSPEEALRTFELEPGLRIELVVAEPLVIDPVAFVFDGPGRLFVAENRGYPDPVEGGVPTTLGRIALLEDVDGDGRFEKRKEFATGLGLVNGLMLWRGGIFVTAAPEILYLKDNDGDGIADEKKVVLTGFEDTKTAQIRVSHPTLGLDGRVYVTSGLNGGKVSSPLHPERPAVSFPVRDGRFDPDSYLFENVSGRAQFGLTFDAFGRKLYCSNRHPVMQVMLEPWHLSRNPHLAFTDFAQEVSKVEAEAKVWPISRATISADFIPRLMGTPHTGTFTAASGVFVYGGTALTPEHQGNVFICESAQNLIQRQVMRVEGSSLRSDPPYQNREFLRTTDVWFRPVYLGSGPDGALYIADMYRREIDHPRYVPEESRGLLDFESGKDRGRIYRIVKDGPRSVGKPAIDNTIAGLVAGLESPDEWWRARSQRLLVERADRAAIPLLTKVAANSARPEAKVRALWTLRSLQALSEAMIQSALRDAHPGVREQGLQFASELMAEGKGGGLLSAVLATAKDSSARVRFCSALALAGVSDASVLPALASIAILDGEDRWARAAVLSGIAGRMDAFLTAIQAERAKNPKAFAVVMEHLGRVFGAGAPPETCRGFLTQMLTGEGDLAWRMASVLGLIEGYRGRGGARGAAAADPFLPLLGGSGKNEASVQAFLRGATERAMSDTASTRERISAISLLGYSDFDSVVATLGRLLDARQAPDVQVQAVRAIERIGDARGGALLIAKENWSRYTPRVREAVLATMTARPALILVLFDAIKAGVIAAPEISSVRRTALMKHNDAKVQETAQAIFKDLEGGDRMQVYRTFRELLASSTDVERGREAYTKACSACHTHQGSGGKVGPDLTGIRNQPADAILLHILVPNYEVMSSYATLSITTQDGRSLSGWLAAESEASVTLRTASGTEETVARKEITSLSASGISLMPDGLEQTMAKEDVGNIVAFLKHDS